MNLAMFKSGADSFSTTSETKKMSSGVDFA